MKNQTTIASQSLLRIPETIPDKLQFQQLIKSMVDIKPDGCWKWNGSINAMGYARIRINKKYLGVNRLSYSVFKGDIPGGIFVCHSCDHPYCVNPEHLFLGTQTDNMRDCRRKDRCALAKLTSSQVEEVKAILKHKSTLRLTLRQIGAAFGVTASAVHHIGSGIRWSESETSSHKELGRRCKIQS